LLVLVIENDGNTVALRLHAGDAHALANIHALFHPSPPICKRFIAMDRMTHEVVEHHFTCPYCWESVSMLLDLSAVDQSYVEDCEVCCNPVSLRFRVEDGGVVAFDAEQLS
jgi:hypothetical protein